MPDFRKMPMFRWKWQHEVRVEGSPHDLLLAARNLAGEGKFRLDWLAHPLSAMAIPARFRCDHEGVCRRMALMFPASLQRGIR